VSVDDQKRRAALAALDHVEDGMKLGLGSGSTAAHFVRALGERVAAGLDVVGVPTSEGTAALAAAVGIRLTTLDAEPDLDLTVDGADELDGRLRLIKGGGGALLREKIVASCSRRMIVIAEEAKEVAMLGKFALPVEVVPFGATATAARITAVARDHGCRGEVRQRHRDGAVFVSDGGHWIYDCDFGAIPDPEGLGTALLAIPGVVEHGLFIGLASMAILGTDEGTRVIGG
jgi:ribose 5-phosphate isomerase A